MVSGRTSEPLATEPASTQVAEGVKHFMLLKSYGDVEEATRLESVAVDTTTDELAAVAKDVLSAFEKPDLNSFGQHFRTYNEEHDRSDGVQELYKTNHVNQTYDLGQEMRAKHLQFNKAVMSVWDCCELLNEFVDESDPDLDEPQIEHLLQTAEAIRKNYPEDDWFHLTGLIHDLGKVLLHPKFGSEPQWAVVGTRKFINISFGKELIRTCIRFKDLEATGDTFPVGCSFDEAIVHHEFFADNIDRSDKRFSSKNGIYEEGCGLAKVVMSWGHDEFMYQVLQHNKTTLPAPALFVIRYHSFYAFLHVPALHREGAYTHLLDDFDKEMLPWLHEFNKFDLYSKSKVRVDVEKVKPYYISLIEKYFPKELRW